MEQLAQYDTQATEVQDTEVQVRSPSVAKTEVQSEESPTQVIIRSVSRTTSPITPPIRVRVPDVPRNASWGKTMRRKMRRPGRGPTDGNAPRRGRFKRWGCSYCTNACRCRCVPACGPKVAPVRGYGFGRFPLTPR